MRSINLLLLLGVLLFSCKNQTEPADPADSSVVVYHNGDIITMEGESPVYAQAVAVADGKISFVGDLSEASKLFPDRTEVDLDGKTLLPGFIDGHVHFAGLGAQAVGANLLAPPDGEVSNIPQLIDELRSWYELNGTDKTSGWIMGLGFDDSVLEEKRFPTRHDLDQVSTEVPIVIIHISGHFCSVNTLGLEMMGVNADTPDPEGGIVRREEGSMQPDGVLEELAAIPQFFKIISPTTPEMKDYYIDKAQELAMSFGYTTAQEGRAMANHNDLAAYAEKGKFKIDVVSYIDYAFADLIKEPWLGREYNNHYRIGGMKITLDGSPQGRTAWRTQPYLIPPDGQGPDYAGYPAIPNDEDVIALFDKGFANNWQTLVHTNGDAAVDQLIRCMKPAIDKYGNDDRRNVLVHGQYIRRDQLDSIKKLKVIPSLFPMHTFYWGDWHKQLIGDSLGNRISPIKTAWDMGLRPTSHTDAPVALPNLMVVTWATVNRVSRSGAVIGEWERLSPYQALQAITINSAHQHFEEDRKGTLTVGKLADLVILDRNPLKEDPMDIKDIVVLKTIKEGEVVFER